MLGVSGEKYRITAYEHLRDERKKMKDVSQSDLNVSPISSNTLMGMHSVLLGLEYAVPETFNSIAIYTPGVLTTLGTTALNVDPSAGLHVVHAGAEAVLNTDPTPVVAAAGTAALAAAAAYRHAVLSGFASALSGDLGF